MWTLLVWIVVLRQPINSAFVLWVLASCHVVSVSKVLCCFLSIMLAILFTFSFFNAYEYNMEILLGFEMEKTGVNLEYWAKNFTQILGHILIRDTDNEIYWASPPPPAFLGVFFCPETAVERIEQLWVKLKNSICKLVHGVKCYIFSLEHILDWHLDVATIVLYLFFKSTVTSTRATN